MGEPGHWSQPNSVFPSKGCVCFFIPTQDNTCLPWVLPSEENSSLSFNICIFKERKWTYRLEYLQVKLLGILIWKVILLLDFFITIYQMMVKILGRKRQIWIFKSFWKSYLQVTWIKVFTLCLYVEMRPLISMWERNVYAWDNFELVLNGVFCIDSGKIFHSSFCSSWLYLVCLLK